jgi:cell division protein FtsB
MDSNIQFTNLQDNQVKPANNIEQAESQIMQNNNRRYKSIFIVIIVVIISALLSGGAVYYWQNKKFNNAKAMMQKDIDDLMEKNKKLEGEINKLKSSSSSFDLFSARQKAKKASVKSYMASAMPAAVICEDEKKTILSGNGGSKMCDGKNNTTWPKIDICGPNDADTQWIVKNGDSSQWTIELNCTEFTDCNGQENAICNSTGCKFSDSCN